MCAQLVFLFIGVGAAHAGAIAGLIAVPKLSLPPALPESLTPEQVRDTVHANQDALQRCYDTWLARHPLRGNTIFAAEVALAVAPDGGSEQLSIRGLDDHGSLATCIERELSAWRFPRSQLGADVHVPLVLAGQKRDAIDRPPSALHRTVTAQRASLTPCLEGRTSRPALNASLSIDADGNTRAAQLRGSERDAKLKSCLREAMLAWRFPRASKSAEFAFPL